MLRSTMLACLAVGTLLIAGCTTPGAPGLQSSTYPAGNDPNSHTTAATGFGLGPEDFNSNGGAFGPDQADGR